MSSMLHLQKLFLGAGGAYHTNALKKKKDHPHPCFLINHAKPSVDCAALIGVPQLS